MTEPSISSDETSAAADTRIPLSVLYPQVDPSYFAEMRDIWRTNEKPSIYPYVKFKNLNDRIDSFDNEDRRTKPSIEIGLKAEF